MPDAQLDTTALPGADTPLNTGSGGSQILTGYVQTYAGDAETVSAQAQDSGSGSPTFTTGINQTVLQGEVSNNQEPTLQTGINQTVLNGGVSTTQPTPINAEQVVKIDIRNTVVQPLEPCISAPYLQLTFRPVDPTAKFDRALQRQASVPFPKKQNITLTEFVSYFAGKVHLKDSRYFLRWRQILPVVIQAQDDMSLNYTSVAIYDLSTALLCNDPVVVQRLNFSQLPLTQITQAADTSGGTTADGFVDYELELDQVVFADLDQATGALVGKNPVESGLFIGP